jgi:endonuclease YncB( thermonuclease family)
MRPRRSCSACLRGAWVSGPFGASFAACGQPTPFSTGANTEDSEEGSGPRAVAPAAHRGSRDPGRPGGGRDRWRHAAVLVEHTELKLRFAEIGTPERGQPWGSRAKQALQTSSSARRPSLRAKMWTATGECAPPPHPRRCAREPRDGAPGRRVGLPEVVRDASLLEDEAAAREAARGLWSLPESPVPP